jgi:hypothetical protein
MLRVRDLFAAARIRRAHRGRRGKHVDEPNVRVRQSSMHAVGGPQSTQRRLVRDRGREHAVERISAGAGGEGGKAREERVRFGGLFFRHRHRSCCLEDQGTAGV